MANKVDFTGALGNEIVKDIEEQQKGGVIIEDKDPLFTPPSKKPKKKSTKKAFPVYMDEQKVNKLDRICRKNGCTRNELVNSMIDFALERYID